MEKAALMILGRVLDPSPNSNGVQDALNQHWTAIQDLRFNNILAFAGIIAAFVAIIIFVYWCEKLSRRIKALRKRVQVLEDSIKELPRNVKGQSHD